MTTRPFDKARKVLAAGDIKLQDEQLMVNGEALDIEELKRRKRAEEEEG